MFGEGAGRRSRSRYPLLGAILTVGLAFGALSPAPRAHADERAATAAESSVTPERHVHGAEPGVRNGELPDAALRSVAGVRLALDAAEDFERMSRAAVADGATIAVTDGYRTYQGQVELKRRKGWLAATPGTSLHGWGIAVDFDMRVTDFAWLRANAADFGWVHPPWARPEGSKPEPWHWEYVGVSDAGGRTPPGTPAGTRPPEPPQWGPGDLVATVRLEPSDEAWGAWFRVREGLDGLEEGARHYPGTAGPGAQGNFAIAGFRRDHAAPLDRIGRLRIGDAIAVRTPQGDVHRYEVIERRILGADDGWAVGPDPLTELTGVSTPTDPSPSAEPTGSTGSTGDDAPALMTVTTSAPGGRLTAVWARLL